MDMPKHRHAFAFKSPLLDAEGNLHDDVLADIQEDLPTVSAGAGAIAGIGVGPHGEPGVDNSPQARARRKRTTMPMQRLRPQGVGEAST